MAEDPELALLTRYLHVVRPNDYDLGKAYTLLRKPGLVPSACTRHLHPGHKDPLTILLLEVLVLKMRNVEQLSICCEGIPDCEFFNPKKWKIDLTDQIFPAVETFELLLPFEDRPDIFSSLRRMFPLPALREMYIELSCELTMPGGKIDFSTLEKIEIICDGMWQDDFRALLRCCPNIRSLQYYSGRGDFVGFDEVSVPTSLKGMLQALQVHHTSISTLSVHFSHEEEDEEFLEPWQMVSDLRCFAKIKDLDLDFHCLLDLDGGFDLESEKFYFNKAHFLHKLPHSVESFRIFKADGRVIEDLQKLTNLEWRTQNFPRMSTIVLEDYAYCEALCGGEEFDQPTKELRDALENVGIQLITE